MRRRATNLRTGVGVYKTKPLVYPSCQNDFCLQTVRAGHDRIAQGPLSHITGHLSNDEMTS